MGQHQQMKLIEEWQNISKTPFFAFYKQFITSIWNDYF